MLLTAPIVFGRLHVLPIVTAFPAQLPKINVRLLFSDRNLRFVEDHVDVVVRIGWLPDRAMVATRVGSMRTVVCASPLVLAVHCEPRLPRDMSDLPCVNSDTRSLGPAWPFRSSDGKRIEKVSVSPRLSVSTTDVAVSAATDGASATRLLHYQCAAAVRNGLSRIISDKFEVEPLSIHLLHSDGPVVSRIRVLVLVEFAPEQLRERLRPL